MAAGGPGALRAGGLGSDHGTVDLRAGEAFAITIDNATLTRRP